MTIAKFLSKLFGKLFGNKELFYIGSSVSLPPPLSEEEEAELLEKIKDEPELRTVLAERNLRLVVYIAKKFENTGIELEDLISIGTIGLIKASKTYDADKSIKPATYASRCIENEILMYIRKNNRLRSEVSLDEPLHVDRDGNELLLADIITVDGEEVSKNIEIDEERAMIRRLVSRLDKRQREIIELRFGLGGEPELTQKQTAERLGISQSYISRLEKKIIASLREQILNGQMKV